jgi:hypothetical protein
MNSFQILTSKFRFDLMHYWNVSIGPEKLPIFGSFLTLFRLKCTSTMGTTVGGVMDDVTCKCSIDYKSVCVRIQSCTICKHFNPEVVFLSKYVLRIQIQHACNVMTLHICSCACISSGSGTSLCWTWRHIWRYAIYDDTSGERLRWIFALFLDIPNSKIEFTGSSMCNGRRCQACCNEHIKLCRSQPVSCLKSRSWDSKSMPWDSKSRHWVSKSRHWVSKSSPWVSKSSPWVSKSRQMSFPSHRINTIRAYNIIAIHGTALCSMSLPNAIHFVFVKPNVNRHFLALATQISLTIKTCRPGTVAANKVISSAHAKLLKLVWVHELAFEMI